VVVGAEADGNGWNTNYLLPGAGMATPLAAVWNPNGNEHVFWLEATTSGFNDYVTTSWGGAGQLA